MNFDDVFRFSAATDVIYGLNSSAEVGREARRLGATRVFLVTDKGVATSGILSVALESLRESKIPFVLFDKAPQDPTDETVDEVACILRAEGCDCVLVAGGGSALCTGKGAALMAANDGRIIDYVGVNKYRNKPLPCIAVPTTAGSGSEVSRITVLTSATTKRKITVAGLTNAPSTAILDPLLLRTVPFGQALASGVDALTHSVEAYISRFSSPITDALALGAALVIASQLERAVLTEDIEPKAQMLYASSMANLACGNAGLGLAHAMNGAITYLSKVRDYPHVPYGLIHAITLPLVLEFNLPSCRAKLAQLAQAMGFSGQSPPDSQLLSSHFIEGIKNLLRALRAPTRLPWDTVSPDDIKEMVAVTLDSPQYLQNPRKCTSDELTELFEKAVKGWR